MRQRARPQVRPSLRSASQPPLRLPLPPHHLQPLLRRVAQAALVAMGLLLACPAAAAQSSNLTASGKGTGVFSYGIVGDTIPQPLGGLSGDAGRGRAIVADRGVGLCLLCHRGPFPEPHLQGDIASDLSGAGTRWSEGQLRLRLVDGRRLNPSSVMPSFHRIDGQARVGPAWQGKPLLSAQQIEDVVAYLRTLRTTRDGS
jgi:L-cysteine S-thiosulfotransferase